MNDQDYAFQFSVVMAVYNVSPFLEEAVESLVHQAFGFDRVQLILADDGSTDGSGAICDGYASRYPENVIALHKPHGGVSSARNAGLPFVRGRYVSFMDGDDRLSSDALGAVHSFFEDHGDETDAVSIPLYFFDGQTGEHGLNHKFRKGSRVIDLDRECGAVQLSAASAFFRQAALAGRTFDERLSFAEDAKLLIQVLLEKRTLGVVSTAKYHYRKRTGGEASALQRSVRDPGWYLPYNRLFAEESIRSCLGRCGYVPPFVQYTIAYDLQWRLTLPGIPKGVLRGEEAEAWRDSLSRILRYVDDDILFAQKSLYTEHKVLALRLKYGDALLQENRASDVLLIAGSTVRSRVSERPCRIEFLRLTEGLCRIEGNVPLYSLRCGDMRVYALVNGVRHWSRPLFSRDPTLFLGQPISALVTFRIDLPLEDPAEACAVRLFLKLDDAEIPLKKLHFSPFAPLGNAYRHAYYHCCGRAAEVSGDALLLSKCDRSGVRRRERAFLKEVWKKNRTGGRKAVLARLLVPLLKKLRRRPLWLVSDRVSSAGDNGEAFFRFLRREHPEIDARFLLSRDSPDCAALRAVGPVLDGRSLRGKLLFLQSDFVLSSQAEAEVCNPFRGYDDAYRDYLSRVRFVFLQHGVTKDDLSAWLNRYNKNIFGFVTSSEAEYRSILRGAYHYTEREVWLTGMPRCDLLSAGAPKKQITVMPTWRQYLMGHYVRETGAWTLSPAMGGSDFVLFFSSLLTDGRLLDAADRLGYTIAFMPHPNLRPYPALFRHDPRVRLLGREKTYREVFSESALVLTDYSSAAFDFAYLRRPVIYAQFDREEFFGGAHVYTKGYFDYERDGFGEVEHDLEGTVRRIIEYMENGCALKDVYRARIDGFFAFSDRNNCRRVFDRIIESEREASSNEG